MYRAAQVIPHVFDNLFLSAEAMASYIAEAMTEGQQFSEVEQMLHLALPECSHLVRGLKIQVGLLLLLVLLVWWLLLLLLVVGLLAF